MAQPLTSRLGLGDRELISLVGAGGKTTLMHALAQESVAAGKRTVITTTTKLGAGQIGGFPRLDRPSWQELSGTLDRGEGCLVVSGQTDAKLLGMPAGWVDHLFALRLSDLILVEADGARGMTVKAPGPDEPVIPVATTTVVAVIGAGALDRVIADVAHRPLRLAALLECNPYDRLTIARAVRLLGHPAGSRKAVPTAARFVVAVAVPDGGLAEIAGRTVVTLGEAGIESLQV